MKEKLAFREWLAKVDAIVQRRVGLSIHDLPDWTYRDAYDDGVSPSAAASRAIRYAKDEW